MFLFQTLQKTADVQVQQVVSAFKSRDGYKTIAAVPKEQMVRILKSEELWFALRYPDLLPKKEQQNFLENMKKLGEGNFGDVVIEAYGQKDARGLRMLFGDLYHSKVGHDAAESLGFLYGIMLPAKGGSRVPDEILKSEWEYSKYPEKAYTLNDLTTRQKTEYRNLEAFIRQGNEAGRQSFFRYANENPQDASMIARTQEARTLIMEAMKTGQGTERAEKLFVSGDCARMLSAALDTAEGINLVGYLWNTNGGRKFLVGLLSSSVGQTAPMINPNISPMQVAAFLKNNDPSSLGGAVNTVLMIMGKQARYEFEEKIGSTGKNRSTLRQEEYRKIYEEKYGKAKTETEKMLEVDAQKELDYQNKLRALDKKQPELKVVPVLLHKTEYDAIVGPAISELKKSFKGKLSDAEFEKLAIDSFERFYYDATIGAGGTKESRLVREARENISSEYLKLPEEKRREFLLEGTKAYLELGIAGARKKIAKTGATGFFE